MDLRCWQNKEEERQERRSVQRRREPSVGNVTPCDGVYKSDETLQQGQRLKRNKKRQKKKNEEGHKYVAAKGSKTNCKRPGNTPPSPLKARVPLVPSLRYKV